MINGQADAAFAATNSGKDCEAAAGPRGLYEPPIDPNNKEGLARMQKVAPFFVPMTATVGADIEGTPGVKTAAHAYPELVAMADQGPELVYNMTKVMVEPFPQYEARAPGINGWALADQDELAAESPSDWETAWEEKRRKAPAASGFDVVI